MTRRAASRHPKYRSPRRFFSSPFGYNFTRCKTSQRLMKLVKIILILLAFVAVVGGGLTYWLFKSVNSPHEHDKANQFVVIEKGSTPKQIIAKLADEGIISAYAATLIYVRT